MIKFFKDWYSDTITAGEAGDIETVLQNIGIFLVIALFIYNSLSIILGL